MRKRTPCPNTLSILMGKVCPSCRLWKDFLTSFAESPKHSDGLQIKCSQCRSNKPGYAAAQSLRRARIRENGGSFTKREFFALCCEHNWHCLCCNQQFPKLCADHVISVVEGGSSDISNIQPLCTTCNLKKRTKTIDYRPDADGRIIEAEITDQYIAEVAAREDVISMRDLRFWKRIQNGETVYGITQKNPALSPGTVYICIKHVDDIVAVARRIIDKQSAEPPCTEVQSNFAQRTDRSSILMFRK